MPQLENTPLTDLHLAVDMRQRLLQTRKELEKQIDAHTDAIKNEMAALGEQEMQVGDYKLTMQIRDRSSLDKGLLMEQGVTADQIKKATKISTYLQLDVREKK